MASNRYGFNSLTPDDYSIIQAVEGLPDAEKCKKKIWAKAGSTAASRCSSQDGGQVLLADVYLEPQIYNAGRFGVDMAKVPTVDWLSTWPSIFNVGTR